MRADPALRVIGSATADPAEDPAPQPSHGIPRLLWDWFEVCQATGIPRRTLKRELAAGRFPQPVLRIGRRPYWNPDAVRQWARGGR
jgi:predicted DNA-binding transcriptional regulator AlpA